MKRGAALNIRTVILVLAAVLLVAGVAACGTSTSTDYELTHTSADAEYILSWDEIVSRCPDIGSYDKLETFVIRGETKELAPGETVSMPEDSPVAWGCLRSARIEGEGGSIRGLNVFIVFCDTDEYLDEYIQMLEMGGMSFEEDGDFVTSVLAIGPPTQSVQLLVGGKQFLVLILEAASEDETLVCGKDTLEELMDIARSNISALEITPLPPEIPDRLVAEDTGHEWQGLLTVRSEELAPAARLPEEEFFNDLWFLERPLMQAFDFTVDKDWRYVITATGEIDTRFEIYITMYPPGEPEMSYGYDQVFSLRSETVTITNEQELPEGLVPPVNVEIKVLFDLPVSWVMVIEE